MIGSAFAAEQVAERLEQLKAEQPDLPIVFDPVMVATSGAALADDATIAAFGRLMDVATHRHAQPARTAAADLARRIRSRPRSTSSAQHGCAVLIKGGHEEGDALADALIEEDNMTSWQGQRIDTTSTHGTGCTLASAIAFFLARGRGLADAVARAREFVRVALHDAPGLGQGAGPDRAAGESGSTSAPGPRLNQVTVTGTDYATIGRFLPRARPQADRRQPDTDYARFETAGGATFSVQIDPEEKIVATTAVYLECDDLDERVEQLARSGHPVRAWPAQPAVDVARGAAARPRRQHHLPLQGGRSAPLPAVADGRLIHRFYPATLDQADSAAGSRFAE